MQVVLRDYAPGAAMATELVNSGAEVWLRDGDQLGDVPALNDFLSRHGLEPGEIARRDLDGVHALRPRLRRLVENPVTAELIEGAERLMAEAGGRLALVELPDRRWDWGVRTPPGASLADEVAVLAGIGVLGVVRALGHERFRPCAAATCRGVFIDSSRTGSRRYCTPGLCGNRTHVANHRTRRTTAE